MRSFRQIVCDVFSNYTLNPSLEAGIVQLNSLRVDSPMEFDCLVKMNDCSFILTTDDENKLVFCIADENYNYSIENGKVYCYFQDTKLWEETGPVALWYQHLLRNVEKIHINYQCITPPSAKFVQYCDHFLSFLKTMGAGFALYNLCKPRTVSPSPQDDESMYNIYDHSMKKSETIGSDPDPDDHTPKSRQTVRDSRHRPVTNYKVKGRTYDESLFSWPDPDDFRSAPAKTARVSNYKVVRRYKVPNSYSSEASVDVNAFNIAKIVMNQNYSLKINKQHVAWAQGIFADILVTVGHIQEGVQVEIKGRLYDLELLILFERDEKAIFRVVGLTEHFRDIRGYLQKKSATFSFDGLHAALYTWDSDRTTRVEKPIVLCEQRQQATESGMKFGTIYKLNSLAHIAPIQTAKGWCGSPLIIINPSIPQKFVGLHTAADSHQGLSSVIYQSDFNELIDMKSESFSDEALVALDFQQVVLEPEPAPENLSPYISVVGKPGKIVDGVYRPNVMNYCSQTQIWPSPFNTSDETVCAPAILSAKDPRCPDKSLDLLTVGVNKFGRPQPEIDLDILDECYEELGELMLNVVREACVPPKILTYLEAFNGWTACQSSPSMNMSAGPGYPHSFECGGIPRKSKMFKFNVEKNMYEFADTEEGNQLQRDCETYEQFLKTSDNPSAVVYVPQLKDEVRPLAKIEACSTRVFLMGPTYHSILWKRYYGAVQALLTLTNVAGPFKIGIDPASTEFSRLHDYLAAVSDVGMTGDYSGFDTCHPQEYLKRNAAFYNKIYQALDPNWTSDHDTIRTRLANQEVRPLVFLNEKIVQLPGGNMSGGPDTGGRNNITGCINMRYAWKILALKHCPEKYNMYDTFTRDAVFGDDLIKSIHPDVVSWYNPLNIRDVVVSLGFKITSAEKSKEVCLEPITNLSFLKRSFCKLPVTIRGVERTYIVGALEDAVFVKMLNWCKTTKRHFYRENDPVRFDTTINATAECCLSEACLKGEEFYLNIKRHLQMCAEHYNIRLPLLPTYRQALYQTYFRETFHPSVKTIPLTVNDSLHPECKREIEYANKKFSSFVHVFEYARAVKAGRFDLAEKICAEPEFCVKIGSATQVAFDQSKLVTKLIRKLFPSIQKLKSDENFELKCSHPLLGKKNLYSTILTNYAKDLLMATESNAKIQHSAHKQNTLSRKSTLQTRVTSKIVAPLVNVSLSPESKLKIVKFIS